MQKAKEAISSVLHKDSHHDADISQHVSQPVTHEQVHEHTTHHNTTAVDREVHEDHHQTTIQPIKDKEVLPEKHHHDILPTETRHHHHGKDREVEHKLQQQQRQFQDSTEVLPERHHQGDTHAKVGEHHHHHIHEHVQPVIEKQTIQPHVVHNVVPVHEVVNKEPVVHKQSVKPPMTMDEFKHGGLAKGGHGSEHLEYKGDPMHVGNDGNISRGQHHHGHDQSAGTGTGLGGSTTTGTREGDMHTHGHPFSNTSGGTSGHQGHDEGRRQDLYNTSAGDGSGSSGKTSEPRYSGLDENVIGHQNVPGSDSERHRDEHKMRTTMRDESEDNEKSMGRSLLDKLTGK